MFDCILPELRFRTTKLKPTTSQFRVPGNATPEGPSTAKEENEVRPVLTSAAAPNRYNEGMAIPTGESTYADIADSDTSYTGFGDRVDSSTDEDGTIG